jgi:putative membrane protein
MGAADVVPGVSGGTVALIVGIYERLVTAISHCDRQLFALVRGGKWGEAAHHLDLRFLICLAAGIGTGIVALGGVVNQLLTDPGTRPLTLAAFFGMIGASTVLVARMIRLTRRQDEGLILVLFGIGAVAAYLLTGARSIQAEPTLPYIFFGGVVAICAMILPGISGAYVLLILGLYTYLTDILKRLPRGDVTLADAATVVVFGAGCALGLVGFSKVLRYLLLRYGPAMMAVLCGLMVGSLRKIWPFQRDVSPPDAVKLKEKVFENYLPQTIDGQVIGCLLTALGFAALVLTVDWAARRLAQKQSAHSKTPAAHREPANVGRD